MLKTTYIIYNINTIYMYIRERLQAIKPSYVPRQYCLQLFSNMYFAPDSLRIHVYYYYFLKCSVKSIKDVG